MQEKHYRSEVASATTDLAEKLAGAKTEDEAAGVLEEHDKRMRILEAKYNRTKEEQMEALKKRLADRRKKKLAALHKAQQQEVRD